MAFKPVMCFRLLKLNMDKSLQFQVNYEHNYSLSQDIYDAFLNDFQ